MTEYLTGKRERVSWIEETSWGSGGTMADGEVVGYDCQITPRFRKGYIETLGAGADNRSVQDLTASAETIEFQNKFVPHNWKWLKYLGYNVADGGSEGQYTHTFSLANTFNSFKMEWAKRHTTNHVLTIIGNVGKSATLSFNKPGGGGRGGQVEIAMECLGKNPSQGSSVTTLTGGNPSTAPFQYRHAKLTLEGTEITEVTGGEMTIDTGISPDDFRYCNSTLDMDIGEPVPQVQRITGRFNVNIKDKTYWDQWDSEDALTGTNKLELIRGANDQIVFTFTGFHVLDGVAPTTLEGVTNVDLMWQALSVAPVATDDTEVYDGT